MDLLQMEPPVPESLFAELPQAAVSLESCSAPATGSICVEDDLMSLRKIATMAKKCAEDLATCQVSGSCASPTASCVPLAPISEEAQADEEPTSKENSAAHIADERKQLNDQVTRCLAKSRQALQFSMTLAEMLAAMVDHVDSVKTEMAVCKMETARLVQQLETKNTDCTRESKEGNMQQLLELKESILHEIMASTAALPNGAVASYPRRLSIDSTETIEDDLTKNADAECHRLQNVEDALTKKVLDAAKEDFHQLLLSSMGEFRDVAVAALREKLEDLPLGALCTRVSNLEQQMGGVSPSSAVTNHPLDSGAALLPTRGTLAQSLEAINAAREQPLLLGQLSAGIPTIAAPVQRLGSSLTLPPHSGHSLQGTTCISPGHSTGPLSPSNVSFYRLQEHGQSSPYTSDFRLSAEGFASASEVMQSKSNGRTASPVPHVRSPVSALHPGSQGFVAPGSIAQTRRSLGGKCILPQEAAACSSPAVPAPLSSRRTLPAQTARHFGSATPLAAMGNVPSRAGAGAGMSSPRLSPRMKTPMR